MAKLGSLEYLLLWLPAAVGEQIYHVMLREAGYSTRALDLTRGDAIAQVADLRTVDPLPTFARESPIDTATLQKWGIDEAPQT